MLAYLKSIAYAFVLVMAIPLQGQAQVDLLKDGTRSANHNRAAMAISPS